MKTTLLNPVEYDTAIMELLRNNNPSESLNLAINLLRDARALAEKKLAKKIEREKKPRNLTKYFSEDGQIFTIEKREGAWHCEIMESNGAYYSFGDCFETKSESLKYFREVQSTKLTLIK